MTTDQKGYDELDPSEPDFEAADPQAPDPDRLTRGEAEALLVVCQGRTFVARRSKDVTAYYKSGVAKLRRLAEGEK